MHDTQFYPFFRDTDNTPASDSCIKQTTWYNDLQFHMDAYDRCTNLGKKILLIVLLSMVEAKKFSDHPRTYQHVHNKK